MPDLVSRSRYPSLSTGAPYTDPATEELGLPLSVDAAYEERLGDIPSAMDRRRGDMDLTVEAILPFQLLGDFSSMCVFVCVRERGQEGCRYYTLCNTLTHAHTKKRAAVSSLGFRV